MALMNDDVKYRRDTALPFQRMSEELLVVDPKSRHVHLMNETGGRIWELLAEKTSVDELVSALGEEFEGATPEALRAEVEAFLADLEGKGLLGARSKT